MTYTEALQIFREFLYYSFLLALPSLALSLVIGLIISVFQAATSIQEQTLSFVPRLLILGLLLVVTAPWIMQVSLYFTTHMIWRASQIGH